jgi:hypothetical protein
MVHLLGKGRPEASDGSFAGEDRNQLDKVSRSSYGMRQLR